MERPRWSTSRPSSRFYTVSRALSLHYAMRPGTAHFIGYYDSGLASDIDTSNSTSSMLFFLGNCLVSWQSLK